MNSAWRTLTQNASALLPSRIGRQRAHQLGCRQSEDTLHTEMRPQPQHPIEHKRRQNQDGVGGNAVEPASQGRKNADHGWGWVRIGAFHES